VVGLGNPGRRHRCTRHNVGFRVLDRLGSRWDVDVSREVQQAHVGTTYRGEERVVLVKPQTFMNAAGESLRGLRRFHRFDAGRLVAVHDDVDLPIGRLRIRVGGGPGGHRGVQSLIEALGEQEFVRVKVGIGRPPAGWDTADWVLAAPHGDEAAVLAASETRAAEAVELVVSDGPERAMNRINQREASHGGSPL
jgi:PTH1 family peptidyl-tRNA hydrolase